MNRAHNKIDFGCRVKMHFSLTLNDGTEAVSTYQESPLVFTLGDGTMEPLLEYALLGLKAGDEQTLEVSGDEVYGPVDEHKVHRLERATFPDSITLSESQIITFATEPGESLPGVIKKIEGDQVLVDFNHPLSGKRFNYRVSILSVEPAE
jgi:FKBP-type peptidyl-prolyl cis-trans isomerase SlpA